MPEEMVIRYCSPTLAGLKTASLFTNPCSVREVCELNRKLSGSDLCACILGHTCSNADLVYVFNPKKLDQDLKQEECQNLLKQYGYDVGNIGCCIQKLKERLTKGAKEFPHEIGLFLGYPIEDVEGFISNKPCKYIGMWKVYGDVDRAIRVFEEFDQCTHRYESMLSNGFSLQDIVHIHE